MKGTDQTVPSRNELLDSSQATSSITTKRAWLAACLVGFLVCAVVATSVHGQTRGTAKAEAEHALDPQGRGEAQAEGEHEFEYLELVVDNGYSLNLGAAELATAVVPPGMKPQCAAGRLLISNDGLKIQGDTSLSPGEVLGFDLDQLTVQASSASIDKLDTKPKADVDGGIWSNDSDLVTLPNGDVVYLRMGRGKWELQPEPDWFSATRKLDSGWGPGARGVIYVWRSVDCGETFSLRAFIDTALLEVTLDDGSVVSGGLPQATQEQLNEDPPRTIWQMGGTDGPMAYVDHETGDLYYTMWIPGNLPDETVAEGSFRLSATKIDRTVVMRSGDRGDNWHQVMTLGFPEWRADMLRIGSRLWFVEWSRIEIENEKITKVRLCSNRIPGTGSDQWEDSFCSPAPAEGAHRWDRALVQHSGNPPAVNGKRAQPVMARGPVLGKPVILQPEVFSGGDGYRVYFVDYPYWRETAPIAPQSADPRNFVHHPTVIDTGEGPVFIYWYDVDEAANQTTIRGRVVISDDPNANLDLTGDFVVDGPFALNTQRWYGDYHTAGGHRSRPNEATTRYSFYPVWVLPGGIVRFARVTYTPPQGDRVHYGPDFEHGRLIEIEVPDPSIVEAPVLRGEDG